MFTFCDENSFQFPWDIAAIMISNNHNHICFGTKRVLGDFKLLIICRNALIHVHDKQIQNRLQMFFYRYSERLLESYKVYLSLISGNPKSNHSHSRPPGLLWSLLQVSART
uniref:(northern house mosquito) hypothetical protein n=1 Tax=Culex pipiens TaxID=7175 RepID=A0A8D8CEZ9_CULPI